MIGLVAAFLTTFSFLPQVIRVVKTRDVRSLSLWMCLMQTTGIGLWLIHGIMIGDVPLIAANSVSVVLVAIILYFKLTESR